jgi:glutathione synthase/RimK-type ligase-like ATP-grasp enzyme
MNKNIFIYGGSKDPNISSITSYIKKNNLKYASFIHHVGEPIDIVLDVNKNELFINGAIFDYQYLFMRNDVFAHLENPNQRLSEYSENVYSLLKQFLLFNDNIKMINRKYLARNGTNKILNLLKAQEIGLLIPQTLISSNIPKIHNDLPSPHKIQKRMLHPEIRVYRIGEFFISFHIQYEGLDYRVKQETTISVVDNDMSLCEKMRALTDWAGLDYAAADFMTDEDGNLRFLEVNSFPMFARFDQESHFAVSKAIIDFLYSDSVYS